MMLNDAVKSLSPAEEKVLDLISQGIPVKIAAFNLGVAPVTVHKHLESIYKKSGVVGRQFYIKHNDEILHGLTFKQKLIFNQMRSGVSLKVVAANLSLAERTVTGYVTQIYKKANVHNRYELFAKYGRCE